MISIVDIESAERASHPLEVARRGIEAQESANAALYSLALQHEASGRLADATAAYRQLLDQPLIAEADALHAAPGDPSLRLRFLALMNLSNLEASGGEPEQALQHALGAVALDERDGRLWLRIGRLAGAARLAALERHSLEHAVLASPHNQLAWCALDALLRRVGDTKAAAQLAARAATTRGLPPGALPLPVPSPPPHAAAALLGPSSAVAAPQLGSEGCEGCVLWSAAEEKSTPPPPPTLEIAAPRWLCVAEAIRGAGGGTSGGGRVSEVTRAVVSRPLWRSLRRPAEAQSPTQCDGGGGGRSTSATRRRRDRRPRRSMAGGSAASNRPAPRHGCSARWGAIAGI